MDVPFGHYPKIDDEALQEWIEGGKRGMVGIVAQSFGAVDDGGSVWIFFCKDVFR